MEESPQFADESSKDSNEEEEGSSSEADEMAAALEAELNDFMWPGTGTDKKKHENNPVLPTSGTEKLFFCFGFMST